MLPLTPQQRRSIAIALRTLKPSPGIGRFLQELICPVKLVTVYIPDDVTREILDTWLAHPAAQIPPSHDPSNN